MKIPVPSASGAIVASKLATAASNVLALVLVAHALSAEAFGTFGAVSGGAFLVGRLLALGCEHGLLRLRAAPAFVADGRALIGEAAAFLAIATVLATALVVGYALALGAPLALWATLGAGIGWAAVELAYWIALARRRHALAVLAQAGTAAGRLAVLAVVAAAAPTREAILVSWAVSGLGLGLLFLGLAAGGARRPRRADLATLVRYSRWQGLGQAVAAAGAQQPVLMLLILGGQAVEAGRLSLATSLLFGVLLIHQGFFEHLSVAVAARPPGALRRFLRAALLQGLALAAVAALLLVATHVLATLFLPAEVWAGGRAFAPMGAVALLVILHGPFEAVLHGLLAPRPILYGRLIRLGLVTSVGLPVSVSGSAADMAWVQVLAALASLGHVALLTLRELSRTRAR